MREYLFFDRTAAERFLDVLRQRGVPHSVESEEGSEPLNVQLEEEVLDDELEHLLDTLYDEMLGETGFLGGEESLEKDLAGFEVALSDGTRVTVPIDAETMKKLTAALSIEEIQTLLSAVVDAVETRDTRPLCHFD